MSTTPIPFPSKSSQPEELKHRGQIEGTYGDQAVTVEIRPDFGNPRLVVNLHGTFGGLHSGSQKYLRFGRSIRNSGAGSSMLVETSRNREAYPELSPYEAKKANFRGKTFLNELEDVRRALRKVVDDAQKIFGVAPSELKITLNGNSLGGILATYLAAEFPQVDQIVTVGTGLRLAPEPETPILSSFPAAEEVRAKAAGFRGTVQQFWGDRDAIFDRASVDDLGGAFVNAKSRALVVALNVDHTFEKAEEDDSNDPYDAVSRVVTTLASEGRTTSGGVAFKSPKPVTAASQERFRQRSLRIQQGLPPEEDDIDTYGG